MKDKTDVTTALVTQIGEVAITRINEELISDVERLMEVLDNDKITSETRNEINTTIQYYVRELREFQMVIKD